MGYTEYYLTHKFKQETGCSVNQYTKYAKIERAKVLLRTSEGSVQEIAERLGFGSRGYFSKVFAEVTGYTPVEFRAGKGTGGE
ncbi:MAG: helix-turn-helix transcriptional regulator [Clostridiales bacterium]|nr:helix-turn-helix transcriptional regulator [Clostridiales bacterium]